MVTSQANLAHNFVLAHKCCNGRTARCWPPRSIHVDGLSATGGAQLLSSPAVNLRADPNATVQIAHRTEQAYAAGAQGWVLGRRYRRPAALGGWLRMSGSLRLPAGSAKQRYIRGNFALPVFKTGAEALPQQTIFCMNTNLDPSKEERDCDRPPRKLSQ